MILLSPPLVDRRKYNIKSCEQITVLLKQDDVFHILVNIDRFQPLSKMFHQISILMSFFSG